MHKTLVINAHPDYKNREHYSTLMEDYFIKRLTSEYPDSRVTVLNLYEENIPRIDDTTFSVYHKNAAGIDLNDYDRYTSLEFSACYLKAMFEDIMGFDKFCITRAQRTDIQPVDREAVIKQTKAEIDTVLADFYSSN